MIKVETYLPLFTGFHETIFQPYLESDVYEVEREEIAGHEFIVNQTQAVKNCKFISDEKKREYYSQINSFAKGLENTVDIWDYFNNSEYERETAEKMTATVQSLLADANIALKMRYQSISSPRTYNFLNDIVDIEVELTPESIKSIIHYVESHRVEFANYVKEEYTSFDGFTSFYSNHVSDWVRDWDNTLSDSHLLGSVLAFILENEGCDSSTLHEYAEIYASVDIESYAKAVRDKMNGEIAKL